MKANKFCIFRLLVGLAAVSFGAGQAGGALPLMARQIEMIGPRQWLGLMAGTIVATTPVIAPISRHVSTRLARWRGPDNATFDEKTTFDESERARAAA